MCVCRSLFTLQLKEINKSMRLFRILFIVLWFNPVATNAASTIATFIGCEGDGIDVPEKKYFTFMASLVIQDKNNIQKYKAKGSCRFIKQVCDGGTLSNIWSANSDEFELINLNNRRWTIELNHGWELNYDYPGCDYLINTKNINSRLWVTKNPKSLPHLHNTIWLSQLLKKDALKLHGLRVIKINIHVQ